MLPTCRFIFCCTTTMLDSLMFLVINMFSSDVPITTAPTIWSVAWDVTHGGWLGSMMILWCYWKLGGTTYLVWLFSYCDVISVHCNVAFSLLRCSFLFFPLLLIRWLDFAFSFLSFSYLVMVRVFLPRNVDLVLPSVEVFSLCFPLSEFLKCFCFLWATFC